MNSDQKRLLNTFLEMVKIYSPSQKENAMASLMMEKLSLLGLNPYKDEFGNVIAVMPSNISQKVPTIFFCCHLDVVEPCKNIRPIVEQKEGLTIIRSDGTTVLGADDKCGIAMILEALTSLIEKDIPHGELEILFTLQEENGMFGSKGLDCEILNSSFGYVLDHSDPVGVVINRAPQHESLSFTFKGKASHAGLQPEQGINAIMLATKAISHMPVGRLDELTTANVGTIKGGIANNIIPDECTVTGEVRSHDIKKLNCYVEKYLEAANDVVKSHKGTSLHYTKETEYRNIFVKPEEPVIQFAQKAAQKLNLEFKLAATNGGSDANVLNHKGIPTVCLGCGYHHPHSTNEWISLEDMTLGTNYVISIIESVIE